MAALSQFCPTVKSCRCPAKSGLNIVKDNDSDLLLVKMFHHLTLFSKTKLERLFANKAKFNKRALGHKHLCLSSILLYALLLMVVITVTDSQANGYESKIFHPKLDNV